MNFSAIRKPDNAAYLSASATFLAWGLLPVYWKALGSVPSLEILCHRIFWSVAFTALFLVITRRWREVVMVLHSPRAAALLVLSGCLIAANWLTYIWAVNNNHVLEASMGYYINPLVNVVLGVVFFRDRLRTLQIAAVGLASLGVAYMIVQYGQFPWVALTLALTFGFYGLVRKVIKVESLPGLFCETLVVCIPAASYLVHLTITSQSVFFLDSHIDTLLVGTGVITTLPLIGFAFAARRMRLITLGIFQYIVPTAFFLLGIFLYREPFTVAHLITFGLIWLGIAAYTADGVAFARQAKI